MLGYRTSMAGCGIIGSGIDSLSYNNSVEVLGFRWLHALQ